MHLSEGFHTIPLTMNILFHYYIVHFLAEQSGFSQEEARTIAWSSQFVDANILSFTVHAEGREYRTIPTQNYGFWNDYFPENVYLPFHFVPGEPGIAAAKRKDRLSDPSSCTPGSPRARELFIDALKTRNPYRIGIGAHAYADSWAHQNFSGYRNPINICDEGSLIPPIGHAQILKTPDMYGIEWEDSRLLPETAIINNSVRYLAAAKMVYKFFCTHNRKSFGDVETVLMELELLLDRIGGEKAPQEELITDFQITYGMEPFSLRASLDRAVHLENAPLKEEYFNGYSKYLWFKDTFLYKTRVLTPKPVKGKQGFFSTPFFAWMEAAKEHLSSAKGLLKDLI